MQARLPQGRPAEAQARPLTDFLINYNHEAKQGDEIALHTAQKEGCYFVEGVSEGHSCFSCQLVF